MSGARDDGQVAPLALILLLAVLAVAALAIDGSLAFSSKLRLSHLADAAARSGTGAVDQGAITDAAGQRVVLDWREAEARARRYLADAACECEADVVATPQAVSVTLRREEPTFFARILGVRSITVGARSETTAGDPDRAAP